MTKEQIDAATAKVVADGGSSTDPNNQLDGETFQEANARITEAYKELLAKPILTPQMEEAGAKVQWVRTGAGAVGEYVVVVPIGYSGPKLTTTKFTAGIIPKNGKYTKTGASKNSGTATTVTKSDIGVSTTSAPLFPNDPTDSIGVLNRLNQLSEKSRSGTAGIGPDKGKEFNGGLTPTENAEFERLNSQVENLLKTGRPVYNIQNPDGTRTLSYTNPTAAAEEQYRQQYGANTSLAQAGTSPYGGGKVLTWAQKQEALKRVEELRPKYASLPYSQQQEFDAIQRNLYASILVNADNANPAGANATSISDNTPELLQQYGFSGASAGVQTSAAGMAPATDTGGTVNMPSLMGTEQSKTAPTDLNSPAAAEYNESLKGKATQGLLSASESQWTKTYNTNRYNILKGKATQGLKLSPQEQAESNFLINLGVGTTTYNPNAATSAPGTPNVISQVPMGGNLDNAAFSIVEGILKNYDMKGVSDSIAKIRKDYPELASDDILALLKFDTRYNGPYLERFAGNAERIKKGLPTLDDSSYLKVEKEYENIFKAYDVGSLANRKTYATLIGNSMDAVDVTGRLKIGYERLKSDKNIETAFRQFYPSLGTGDIVAAMLNPEEMLPALERKAAAAEIGGSYLAQGLEASKVSAESLAAYGITKAGAQAGVRYIAQALPRGRALSQIYGETGIDYTQQTAEDITFKKNVKAQQEEDILKAKEIGTFSASSGIMSSKSLASQTRAAGLI